MFSIDTGITLVTKILDMVDGQLKKSSHRSTLLRLLYLELCSNLELFSVIKRAEKLRDLDFGDSRLAWIVGNFDTEILDTLLLGDAETFNAIGAILNLPEAEDGEEDSLTAATAYLPRTAFQAMKYLGRQLGFLKTLAASPELATGTGVRVGLRLERVKDLCVELVSKLGQDGAVRPMTGQG
jgi:hypothetical protein